MTKVYVAFTGGTIGMSPSEDGHLNKRDLFAKFLLENELINSWLSINNVRIEINEYDPLIDSSNVTPILWWEILTDIKRHYKNYDGFIVVHGTDTLSYTSSILSFLIEENYKPIVITGAQRPIFKKGSDGVNNMLNSIKVASGKFGIKEVCVVFGNLIMRGARTTKVSALNDNAFASPQALPLGRINGDEILINKVSLRKIDHKKSKFSEIELTKVQVAVLKLFPGFVATQITQIINAGIKGIVIEAYGLGTAPRDSELIGQLEALKELQIPVVVVSQPIHGFVKLAEYESSSVFRSSGAISGYDMTTEAAVTKLYYLLNQNFSYEKIKKEFRNNLRGELSTKLLARNFEIKSE